MSLRRQSRTAGKEQCWVSELSLMDSDFLAFVPFLPFLFFFFPLSSKNKANEQTIKQTHRYRKPVSGYQREGVEDVGEKGESSQLYGDG